VAYTTGAPSYDAEILPEKYSNRLKGELMLLALSAREQKQDLSQSVSKSFRSFFVAALSSYHSFFKIDAVGKYHFDKEAFMNSRLSATYKRVRSLGFSLLNSLFLDLSFDRPVFFVLVKILIANGLEKKTVLQGVLRVSNV